MSARRHQVLEEAEESVTAMDAATEVETVQAESKVRAVDAAKPPTMLRVVSSRQNVCSRATLNILNKLGKRDAKAQSFSKLSYVRMGRSTRFAYYAILASVSIRMPSML